MFHSSALDICLGVAQEGEQFYSAVCITFKTSLMMDQHEKFTASSSTTEFVVMVKVFLRRSGGDTNNFCTLAQSLYLEITVGERCCAKNDSILL